MTDLTSVLTARDREYERLYNNHDTNGVVNMYTEDCRWMQPEKDTQIGRDAVKSFLNTVMDAGANSLILEMDENGSLGTSDLVYQRSRYTFLKTDGSLFGKGKLVVIWKKVNAVKSFLNTVMDAGANSLILEMDENGSLGTSDLVYQRSRYTFLKTDGSLFGKGKLVVIWKKVNGVYHLYTKIFNPSPA